ncbi:MAG: UDP-N-acetylglucosamine 2-epimerase [Candidatus Nitrosopumilus sp. bin_6a]
MTSNDYLLVDKIQDIDEIGDHSSKTIISFDYESHILLNEQKIPHTISDEFSSPEELHSIEKQVYSLVNWYEIPSVQNLIVEDGINLGELFFLEFRAELVSFLKKFSELSKLVKLHPDSNYFVSETIWELISRLTKNVTKINIKTRDISMYNSIDVPLKLGSKQLTMKLSTKNASRIQNFLNKASQSLFLNKTINKKFPTVLIVNFSTLKTESFLLEIPKFDLNVVKYDRTTPAIWNTNTLNIIKNSKCVIENESTLLDKSSSEKIKLIEKSMMTKIDSILSSKDFETFFALNGESFWNEIKPLITRLCRKRFLQASKEIQLAKNLLKKYSFSKILLFHESGIVEQIVLSLGKKQKIPVCVLQHGLYFDSKEMIDENQFQRVIPKKSDYFLGWGDIFKNFLENNNVSSNQIKNIGSIFHDRLFKIKKESSKVTGNVLLASDPLAFNRPIDLSINQKELYNKTIENICKTIYQNNKKLIIKTHPQKHQSEENIAKKIDEKISVLHSGDILPLIESSDLVIVTDVTTVIIEAMMMQKPVISIRIKDHYGKPKVFDYCDQISLDSLDSWIKSFYNEPNIKNHLIERGNEFLNTYLSNQENSSKKILEFLQD